MSFICIKKNLSPLQRRALQRASASLSLTVAVNILARFEFEHTHTSLIAVLGMAALCLLPIAIGVAVIGRYLAAEQDEFVRALVMRALLWGFAVTMAGDAIAGVFMQYYSMQLPLALLNVDLLFASTGIAFRLLQWSYR